VKNNKNNRSNPVSGHREKSRRDVDTLVQDISVWWGRTFVFIKKTKVETWKGVAILAFIAGIAATIVWVVSFNMQMSSRALGTASLRITADRPSIAIGESFTADVDLINTDGENVIAAKAVIAYDPNHFSLNSWDTSTSIFSIGNTCIYNGKACEIINNDTANGRITITLAKPTPGVHATSGRIARLSFRGLQPISPTAANIRLDFVSAGNYSDSDVIFDDEIGTDILTSVSGATVTVSINPPTCTSFTYSNWGACQPNNTQTRTITSSSPAGCSGGSPVLVQGCSYVAPACVSLTYSNQEAC
jgi:hypothetical protein